MKRGDLITIAVQGDFGKPRPALVIQSDNFNQHPSITILPITSKIVDAPLVRITIEPSDENGLSKKSQVMVDKTLTIPKEKAGQPFGFIDYTTAQEVDRCLAVFLGIAK